MLTVAYHYDLVKTRFGVAAIVWFEDRHGPRITRILLPSVKEEIFREIRTKFPAAARKHCDLIAIFSADIRAFTGGRAPAFNMSLLDLSRVPPFHRKVLRALAGISKGTVSTYGEIAMKAGSPGGARAAGQGCANNPFPIVFPCHRVIRSDGSLGGFGGGHQLKQALLDMEGVRFDSAGKVKREFITP
ncbi:MAG TPA: MGMT family protein [Syntrophales bacterium]|nr:MGMT family protein [Syntrophales bacterium]